jgi:hypothetical protein
VGAVLALFGLRVGLGIHVAAVGMDARFLLVLVAFVVSGFDVFAHGLLLLILALPVFFASVFVTHVGLRSKVYIWFPEGDAPGNSCCDQDRGEGGGGRVAIVRSECALKVAPTGFLLSYDFRHAGRDDADAGDQLFRIDVSIDERVMARSKYDALRLGACDLFGNGSGLEEHVDTASFTYDFYFHRFGCECLAEVGDVAEHGLKGHLAGHVHLDDNPMFRRSRLAEEGGGEERNCRKNHSACCSDSSDW